MNETPRRFEVIDLPDGRCPFGLVDRNPESSTFDQVIRIGPMPRWLSDYAFERENADEVTYAGEFLLRVESERDRWPPNIHAVPKTEEP